MTFRWRFWLIDIPAAILDDAMAALRGLAWSAWRAWVWLWFVQALIAGIGGGVTAGGRGQP